VKHSEFVYEQTQVFKQMSSIYKMVSDISKGTIRFGIDLKTYEFNGKNWKISNKEFLDAIKVIDSFKSNNFFNYLIDQKNPKFLKGQLSEEGKIQGARINVLPTGEKLDKAYSLFGKDLTIHDEKSHDHWDVIYRNPNGKYAYLYTLNKKSIATKNKYNKVNLFAKVYNKLEKNVITQLNKRDDIYALPIYTLLKTCMRVGNEANYNENGHKGLTTLKKSDITIQKNKVQFKFIAKSGVPMKIIEDFPENYIKRLKERLNQIKNSDFIFTSSEKRPLKDTDFMKAFEIYCGEKFYPHIVRSYYATKRAEEFIKQHKEADKQEVNQLFLSIADKLGHKKFDKKNNEWKDNFTVTIHHYIQPSLVEKIQNLIN